MLTREHLLNAVHFGLGGACAPEDQDAVVAAVIEAIIEHTDSPRTVEELNRLRVQPEA